MKELIKAFRMVVLSPSRNGFTQRYLTFSERASAGQVGWLKKNEANSSTLGSQKTKQVNLARTPFFTLP